MLTSKRLFGFSCRRAVKKIYCNSFSREERMPFFMMCILSLFPTTKFYAYYDGDVPCGFTYHAVIGRQVYVLFFAVDEALRGRGYGSQILSILKAGNPKKRIVVSIEPCPDGATDGIERRRKIFYQRNGFSETGYMIKLGKMQELLIANGDFSKAGFRLFLAGYSLFTLWPAMPKKRETTKDVQKEKQKMEKQK